MQSWIGQNDKTDMVWIDFSQCLSISVSLSSLFVSLSSVFFSSISPLFLSPSLPFSFSDSASFLCPNLVFVSVSLYFPLPIGGTL